jgi:probable addiction module antidote protein
MESIGKEIKEIARKKRVSLYRIAKDLGIAQESLFRSLMDNANPKWNTIKRILDYLGCEIQIVKPRRKHGHSEPK